MNVYVVVTVGFTVVFDDVGTAPIPWSIEDELISPLPDHVSVAVSPQLIVDGDTFIVACAGW